MKKNDQPWGGQNTLSGGYIVNLITDLGVFIKMLFIGGVLLLSEIAITTPEIRTPHYSIKWTVFGPFSTYSINKNFDEMRHVHLLLDKMGLDEMGLDEMALNQNNSR